MNRDLHALKSKGGASVKEEKGKQKRIEILERRSEVRCMKSCQTNRMTLFSATTFPRLAISPDVTAARNMAQVRGRQGIWLRFGLFLNRELCNPGQGRMVSLIDVTLLDGLKFKFCICCSIRQHLSFMFSPIFFLNTSAGRSICWQPTREILLASICFIFKSQNSPCNRK